DVFRLVLCPEDVEEAAIDNRVEPRRTGQLERVGDCELRRGVAGCRLLVCQRDRAWREVDAQRVIAPLGEVDGVFTSPAARVQDPATDLPSSFQLHDGRLRLADVPGRGAALGVG